MSGYCIADPDRFLRETDAAIEATGLQFRWLHAAAATHSTERPRQHPEEVPTWFAAALDGSLPTARLSFLQNQRRIAAAGAQPDERPAYDPLARSGPQVEVPTASGFSTFDLQQLTRPIVTTQLPTPKAPPMVAIADLNTTASWKGVGGSTITPQSGNWSVATNWDTGVPNGTESTVLNFGGSETIAYTSTNDLGGGFTFGTINLNSTAFVTETINGNGLLVPLTGSTISQNNRGTFLIGNDISGAFAFGTSQLHLTGGTSGTGTVTFSGTLSNGGNADTPNRLKILKDGPNTVIFTGANTYSGSTDINGGTLLANNTSGSATGSSTVGVNNGGTLGGTGTIIVTSGAVIVSSGGTINPGNGPGQIGALTLNESTTIFTGGRLLIDIGATSSDQLLTNGVLNISAFSTIDFNQLSAPTLPSYTLVTYTSVTGGFFTPLDVPMGYALVYGMNELDLVAVPEPATWVTGTILATAAVVQRRFRRKRSR